MTREDLVNRRCVPCEGGVPALSTEEARTLLEYLDEGWRIARSGQSIARRFEFPAYGRTIAFANAVAWIATVEGHHPVMTVGYGACEVEYWTHAIDGLSENDFVCAAKIDRLVADL